MVRISKGINIMFSSGLLRLSVILGAAALLLSCDGKDYKELAEKPKELLGSTYQTQAESKIVLNTIFQYDVLNSAIARSVPTVLNLKDRVPVCLDIERQVQKTVEDKVGGDVGKLFGAVAKIVTKVVTVGLVEKKCLDVDYTATITRDEPASISQSGDALRVSIPLKINGNAGFSGDLAKLLSIDRKAFRGSITAWADIKPLVDESWCPKLTAIPGFVWRDKAQLEVAGRFWINIDSQVNSSIGSAMDDAIKKLPEFITCEQISELVKPLWHEYYVPLPKESGVEGVISIRPERAGFSGITAVPSGVQLAMMLIARTEVKLGKDFSQPKKEPMTLPPLEEIPVQDNQLNLSIPVTVSYSSLQEKAEAFLRDKTFEGEGGPVTAKVKIKEIEVYPSNEKIVIGIAFETKISSPESLAPKGRIYLVGTPSFDVASQTLKLTDIEFSRILDNDLWNVVSYLFQDEIVALIHEKLVVDLSGAITKVREGIDNNLRKIGQEQGINVNLREDFLGLKKVSVSKEGVVALVNFQGAANIIILKRLD